MNIKSHIGRLNSLEKRMLIYVLDLLEGGRRLQPSNHKGKHNKDIKIIIIHLN
jgi:hypothetical protein